MTDVVERLRKFFQAYTDEQGCIDQDGDAIMKEAADEIERLRQERAELHHMNQQYVIEITRLRRENVELVAAVETIAKYHEDEVDSACAFIARAAIEKAK